MESQIIKGGAGAAEEPFAAEPASETPGIFTMPALPGQSVDVSRSPEEGSSTPHLTPPGTPAAWTAPGFSPHPAASAAVVPTVPTAGPAPTVPTAASAPTVPTAAPLLPNLPAGVVTPAASAPVAPVTPVQPVVSDPIDESPEAVWYVRPPSGGQYGPARGDVMRKWIGEGRISADSMVWREGWDDWRSGGAVFPYLRAAVVAPVTAPAPVAYAPSAPAAAPGARGYSTRRRSSLALAVTTVVILGLMSIALLITLVLVINSS